MFSNLFRILLVTFLLLVLVLNFGAHGEEQFSFLAQSFLKGHLYLPDGLLIDDAVPFSGHYFWPQGFAPAVVLIPFVYLFGLFGQFFYQGYLNFFLVIGVFFLIYKISIKLGYKHDTALFLGFTFCFSSAFLGVALLPSSWYFAQVVTVFFLLLGLKELLFGKQNYLLIGFLFGIAAGARINTVLYLLLPIIMIFSQKNRLILKIIKLLTFPVLIIVLVTTYNYLRFADPFNFGHIFGPLGDPATKSRLQGVYNWVHMPTNIRYLLFGLPKFSLKFPFIVADPWGMSIFITSPYLFYLFFLKYHDKLSKYLLLIIFCVGITPLLFYSTGFRQFGYRYSLDFFPLLFLLLIKNYKEQKGDLSIQFKSVVLCTAFSNIYLFFSLFK